MRLVSRTGAHAVAHADHGTFTADPDGTIEVPHELGVELLTFGTLWRQATADDVQAGTGPVTGKAGR